MPSRSHYHLVTGWNPRTSCACWQSRVHWQHSQIWLLEIKEGTQGSISMTFSSVRSQGIPLNETVLQWSWAQDVERALCLAVWLEPVPGLVGLWSCQWKCSGALRQCLVTAQSPAIGHFLKVVLQMFPLLEVLSGKEANNLGDGGGEAACISIPGGLEQPYFSFLHEKYK